jgi:hypothetical protein
MNGRAAEAQRGAAVNAREQFAPAAAHLDAVRRCAEGANPQSSATLWRNLTPLMIVHQP